MFLAISIVSMDVMAQRLTDSGYRTVGYIKQDGEKTTMRSGKPRIS